MASCAPSSLINSIHNGLPYFTHTSFSDLNITTSNTTLDFGFLYDDVWRALGWSAILFVMAVIAMAVTCCSCCFICGFCCGGKRKPVPLKLCLGITTLVLTIVSIVLVFVAFGVESGIDNAIISNVKSISQGTMNNSDGSTVDISGYITSVEPIRHWLVNGYFIVVLFVLLGKLASVIFAPICKSSAAVYVFVGVIGFVTFLLVVLMISIFAVIVLYTDTCIVLYSFQELCTDELISATWSTTMDIFCNKTVGLGFTLFMLCATMFVLFILLQAFGLAYGTSLSGRRSTEIVTVTQGGVWDDQYDGALPPTQYSTEDAVPLMSVVRD